MKQCHEAVTQFEDSLVEAVEHKRAVSKGVQPRSNLLWQLLSRLGPELDSTLINKLTDDKQIKRSVVFDGAVRSVRAKVFQGC